MRPFTELRFFQNLRSAFAARLCRSVRRRRIHRRRPIVPAWASLELLEDRIALSTFTVNNVSDAVDNDPSTTSLREALLAANEHPGIDAIQFDISGAGPHRVQPMSRLPDITDAVVIDGYTQPGASPNTNPTGALNAVLKIEINGAVAGQVRGFGILAGGSGSTIRGLVINDFYYSGVGITGASDVRIAGNFIGTDVSGTQPAGNPDGVVVGGGSTGNWIGTDGDGTNDAAERNLISGSRGGVDPDGVNVATGVTLTGEGTSGNVIAGNLIGVDVHGQAALANENVGVAIWAGASSNLVGTDGNGTADIIERNVISGNVQHGVFVVNASDNVIAGNYIGVDASGAMALPNQQGIRIGEGSRANRIGTNADGVADADERNVISGNELQGIEIWHVGTEDNVVAGNYVGTDVTGTVDLGNGTNGVNIAGGASQNLIGTNGDGVNDSAERNVISGNDQTGVVIRGVGSDGNVVAGNYVGTDVTGTVALGNGTASLAAQSFGIAINSGAQNNRIGTDADGVADAAERNVLSGNLSDGIKIQDGSHNNIVAGNFIGTDVTGTKLLYDQLGNQRFGNQRFGVFVHTGSQFNRIGTNGDGIRDAVERNVISGNGGTGILVARGASSNTFAGNYVGTDVTGSVALGNGRDGVRMTSDATLNVVGTNGDGVNDLNERNVISGNAWSGLVINGASNNAVAGNLIGVTPSGAALGNGRQGVEILGDAQSNRIGSNGDGQADQVEGNIIAFNSQNGVLVDGSGSTSNSIRRNSIHSNGGLGIDLGADGVTANDDGDSDAGSNQLQNYPFIWFSEPSPAQTRVVGLLKSTPLTTFALDFYANSSAEPSGHGEGERWLGSVDVTTNAAGELSFDTILTAATAADEVIAATATDPTGNTSEFSSPNRAPVADAGGPYTVAEGATITLTASASTDPDGDPGLTYQWDLDGDGIFGETGAAAARGDETGSSTTFSAVGLDGPSSVTVSLRVTDQGGLTDVDTASIDVTNSAPSNVVIDSSVSEHVLAIEEFATFGGNFSDDGSPDTHTAVWSFENNGGTDTRAGTVNEGAGGGTVSDSFSFSEAGVYSVTLTVEDDDGAATTSASRIFVVYDPSGGFVTGGGWITSPAGAYPADPELTGKAHFGFVSRYKHGATVPTGNTSFQFQAASLRFKSSSYEWLVVAGGRAQVKGAGTLNGGGDYGFLLTAIDGTISGNADKLRIKIWDKNDGEQVLYDNKIGSSDGSSDASELGGGSIVIHTGKPLRASAGALFANPASNTIADAELAPLVAEVFASWDAAGISPRQLSLMDNLRIRVADLGGNLLGMAYEQSNLIIIDDNGAGWGWHIGSALPREAGANHFDLLTVLAHEIGHALGYDHSHDEANLMASHLPVGTRRLPSNLPLNAGDTRITDMAFLPSQFGGVLQSVWEGSNVELDSSDEDLVLARRLDGTDTLALNWPRAVHKSDANHIAAVVKRDEDDFDVGGGVLDELLLELLADDLGSI